MTHHTASAEELEALARHARWLVLSTVADAGAGHIGGPLSQMDLLLALYFNHLRIDPSDPHRDDRDRFVLSKGHTAIGLYTVLALRGYFDPAELATFDHGDSRLQGHPDMRMLPGIDASTGSLGQGLSVAVGMALGARLQQRDFHTWVLLGDGEIEEGMVWEAAYAASRYGLDNVTAIVDRNGLQQYGWPAGASDRFDRRDPWAGKDVGAIFRGFGWDVIDIDGHDHAEIDRALETACGARGSAGRPTVILAETVKGKGVSFTEGTYRWHNGIATADQLAAARAELGQPETVGVAR
ncbi:transketolase [Nakamurella leprariae]|uniref:Transketolase n=1 Tax=Nakamurella leprariae TaxID=2803911 RepID=A0A938YIS3_9ACTN|nr:transketolase [Nakamurella leprariae]MBM9468545.1 transketolase [Nakamurella leprariae]